MIDDASSSSSVTEEPSSSSPNNDDDRHRFDPSLSLSDASRYLVERACDGSRSVWTQIQHRYANRLVAYATYLSSDRLRRHVMPEEIVDEAMFAAFSKIEKFKARHEQSFFAWLRLNVERLVIDHGRRLERRSREICAGDLMAGDQVHPTAPAAAPDHIVHHREVLYRFVHALNEIAHVYREVLVDAYFRGHSPATIAKNRHRKVNTVHYQIRRGREIWKEKAGVDPLRYF